MCRHLCGATTYSSPTVNICTAYTCRNLPGLYLIPRRLHEPQTEKPGLSLFLPYTYVIRVHAYQKNPIGLEAILNNVSYHLKR